MSARLTVFRNLFSNIAKIDSDKLMKNVLKNDSGLQQDILDLNRINQLYDKGEASDGALLGQYSPATIQGTSKYEGKIKKGQRYDHITLKDTGEFYESFKIKVEANDYYVISADTIKPDTDLMTYGNILGLSEESKRKMIGWVKAPFVNEMRKAILK